VKARTSGPQAGFSGLSGLFWTVALFSTVVNALMLVAPLYMLQIYDRVIPSRSHETLLALTVLIAALFAVMGILDYVRGRVAARVVSGIRRISLAALTERHSAARTRRRSGGSEPSPARSDE
jgi:ATP-binding cassette, subfamily C, bacterial